MLKVEKDLDLKQTCEFEFALLRPSPVLPSIVEAQLIRLRLAPLRSGCASFVLNPKRLRYLRLRQNPHVL